MDDNFNTFAGWALFSGIVGLGISSISSHYFQADKAHRPHKMGYEIAGVEAAAGAKEVPLATLLASADPAKGEAKFKQCVSCHTIAQGAPNGIGPNLYGVVGEDIGKGAGGFAFSPVLSGHGGKWDFESLNAWLTSPKKFADGTKMTFAGLPSAEDRANVIVYLNAQGSNLPLPAAPAADAAPADGKASEAAAAPAAPGAPEAAAAKK